MEDEVVSRLDAIEGLLVRHLTVDVEQSEKTKHWHLKKEVTVAHLISSAAIITVVIASWFTLTNTVDALDARTLNITDTRVAGIEDHVEVVDDYMRENFGTINRSLITINGKLDVLEERTIENRPR